MAHFGFVTTMRRGPDSTLPSERLPAVVLVTPEPHHVAACEQVVRGFREGPVVKITDVRGAATTVGEWKPFAVVIPEPVYGFDPREFDSLAKAVGAEVIVVTAAQPAEEVVKNLAPRLRASLSWWQARGLAAP